MLDGLGFHPLPSSEKKFRVKHSSLHVRIVSGKEKKVMNVGARCQRTSPPFSKRNSTTGSSMAFFTWWTMPLTLGFRPTPVRHHLGPPRLFYPVNSLVVSRNLWLILWSKIWLFLNLVKHASKILMIPNLCFFSSWVFSNFAIFYQVKVAKHIWEPCCHMAVEIGSWFPLIPISNFMKMVDSF